jgi:hypothetical protein
MPARWLPQFSPCASDSSVKGMNIPLIKNRATNDRFPSSPADQGNCKAFKLRRIQSVARMKNKMTTGNYK